MAGLALFGPLDVVLASQEPVELLHRLESVKIIPSHGANEAPDYAPITVGAMAMAELQNPERSRAFCLAITSESDDQWRPTLWSAHVDAACAGANDGQRRLVVVSAGNLRSPGENYPAENHVSSVEDPSQAWNVLSIGAYTDRVWPHETGLEDYECIARPGTLAPGSRTSLSWENDWPYKPDVVFEGGNYAKDSTGFVTTTDNLQVLTTRNDRFGDGLLGVSRDTSAATAQAARMVGVLQAEYPEFWPETIRGLVVHSAEWTPQMIEEFPYRERRSRMRVYGMGVPCLERARRCARGVATMVIQDELQPYILHGSKVTTHEMHVHALPIPTTVLQSLSDTEIEMRVTLSYFIEPNPPRRGYVAQHRYASHGLRFSVRRSETRDQMMKRLSKDFWPDENRRSRKPPETIVADERKWDLGPESVAVRGSVHSDCWRGTAAQLALSDLIAVYPVSGWWRERLRLGKGNNRARYALIVTISTKEEKLDLFTAVAEEIRQRVAIGTEIRIGRDEENDRDS